MDYETWKALLCGSLKFSIYTFLRYKTLTFYDYKKENEYLLALGNGYSFFGLVLDSIAASAQKVLFEMLHSFIW